MGHSCAMPVPYILPTHYIQELAVFWNIHTEQTWLFSQHNNNIQNGRIRMLIKSHSLQWLSILDVIVIVCTGFSESDSCAVHMCDSDRRCLFAMPFNNVCCSPSNKVTLFYILLRTQNYYKHKNTMEVNRFWRDDARCELIATQVNTLWYVCIRRGSHRVFHIILSNQLYEDYGDIM